MENQQNLHDRSPDMVIFNDHVACGQQVPQTWFNHKK